MAQAGKNDDKLSGIIEVDEFFLAYSEKGDKTLISAQKARKRGGDIDKRTKEGQVAVLLSIDRSKHMITPILSADTSAEIAANFANNKTVNGAIALFKSWVNGQMRGVTTKYLSHYLAWFKESNAKLDKRRILIAAYGGQQCYGT